MSEHQCRSTAVGFAPHQYTITRDYDAPMLTNLDAEEVSNSIQDEFDFICFGPWSVYNITC